MRHTLFTFVFFISAFCSFSQKPDYSVAQIPDSLKQNANAVVRLDQTDIVISSQRKMKVYTKRIVTVLNERGQNVVKAAENYDKSSTVNNIEATIYNAFGKEIKHLKRSDFRDQSATDEGTIFSDNRLVYLDYTPPGYPFTVVYQSEYTTSNTAFLPAWMPLADYYTSVELSKVSVSYPHQLGFNKKELNFSQSFNIQKTENPTSLNYVAANISAKKQEASAPGLYRIFPHVMFALKAFSLEGIDGAADSWKSIGKWFYDDILSGTTELPSETKAKIKSLVGDETDPIKKARIVYQYVQGKTRYVSIQEGIGGWKPMMAKDVDRLGYGDCKALTNYTRSLLSEVGVESYYARLYGSQYKKGIVQDIVSFQSNHVILAIPNNGGYEFLECTSQTVPFGYQGTFTDDRQVLLIKPDGGEIVHTKIYPDKENMQFGKGKYSIAQDGRLSGTISITSQGTQYGQKMVVENLQPNAKEAYYKEYWDNINNLKILKSSFLNDKQKITFTENLEVDAVGYGEVNGNSMIFPVNAFNQLSDIPQRYRTRNYPLEIQRGFEDKDEIELQIPENYSIDAKPNDFEIKDKFGHYKAEFILLGQNKLLYKRTFLLHKGLYDKSEYENYRKFIEQIVKADNSKMLLNKRN